MCVCVILYLHMHRRTFNSAMNGRVSLARLSINQQAVDDYYRQLHANQLSIRICFCLNAILRATVDDCDVVVIFML